MRMKLLATITEQDINPGTPAASHEDFDRRQAVRAVLTNDVGEVALLHASKRAYHKLPGGGIERGEDVLVALRREIVEETGCTVQIGEEVGQIDEYRDEWFLFQTSFCYLAKVIGEPKSPTFTQEELSDGFELMWVKDIDTAIALLTTDHPENYDGRLIVARDLLFLKTAKELPL